MRAVDIIAKNRDGYDLTRDEIVFIIGGYTRGEAMAAQAVVLLAGSGARAS